MIKMDPVDRPAVISTSMQMIVLKSAFMFFRLICRVSAHADR